MAESVLCRVQRMFSAQVEGAVDAAERASGTSLMREAIREVERVGDKLRERQRAAERRRLDAARRQEQLKGEARALDEQARFAMSKGREDLARQVLARQLDDEQEMRRLDQVGSDAAAEEARLEAEIAELGQRKRGMERELATVIEGKVREESARPNREVERKLARAEAVFARAAAAQSGSGNGRPKASGQEALAEIEALKRESAAEERLAALRAAMAATAAQPAKAGRQRKAS